MSFRYGSPLMLELRESVVSVTFTMACFSAPARQAGLNISKTDLLGFLHTAISILSVTMLLLLFLFHCHNGPSKMHIWLLIGIMDALLDTTLFFITAWNQYQVCSEYSGIHLVGLGHNQGRWEAYHWASWNALLLWDCPEENDWAGRKSKLTLNKQPAKDEITSGSDSKEQQSDDIMRSW